MVNIPIKLFSAADSGSKIDFDMLHKEDLGPIRYARVCKLDGKEIPYEEIVKGYEYEPGDYVVLSEADFKKADAKKTSTVEVQEFVTASEINPILFEKPYYLAPQKGAEKPYTLLALALAESKKVGIAKFVLRNKEHLAALIPNGKTIILNQLRFQEEIRSPEELAPQGVEAPRANELEMALALIEQLTKKFEPKEFKDTYTAEVKAMISQKAAGKQFKSPAKTPQVTQAEDIMRMLKASLEKERQRTR